jgi:hypothetical protein
VKETEGQTAALARVTILYQVWSSEAENMNKTSNTSVQSSELGIGQYLPTGLYFDVAKQPQVTTHFVAQN